MASDVDQIVKLAPQVEKRRAEKVAQFLELIRDPDLASYVNLLRNGDASLTRSANATQHGFKNGNGLREAIRSIHGVLPPRFTASQILEHLQHRNFKFAAKDPGSAIRDALYILKRDGELKIAVAGKGGKENQYEWAAKKAEPSNR